MIKISATKYLIALLGLACLLSAPVVALASDISNAIYLGYIEVSNNGTATANVSTVMTMSTQNLIDAGYLTSDCSNSAMRTDGNVDTAYMPAVSTNYLWSIFVPSIDVNERQIYKLYLGETDEDLDGKIRYFPGSTGFAVNDSPTLELGDNFTIEWKGFVNPVGGNKYLVLKTSAIYLRDQPANTLQAYMSSGAGLQLDASITGGEHKIELYADTANFTIEIDDVVGDTIALGGGSVPDNANNWALCYGDIMPYMEYLKIWVDGVLQLHIIWQNSATFTDQSGNGHNATPTFRTASSDADVGASLVTFKADEFAELASWTLVGTTEMIQADDLPSTPANAYTELQVTNLFLAPVFTALINDTDYEPATFWYPVTIVVIGLISIAVHMMTRSILAQGIIEIVLIAIASFTVIPWWCMVVFVGYAFAIVLASNRLPGGI